MIPVFVSEAIERGWGGHPFATGVTRAIAAWIGARASSGIHRPLALPERARCIGVGGATWGGSGKTPLAIALAESLARVAGSAPADRANTVALVGHAYAAHPLRARFVEGDEPLVVVGDEALLAARALAHVRDRDRARFAGTVVAPSRQEAVDFAASCAGWLVVDGLLQATPRRVDHSVLVLDAHEPWGSAEVAPAGDLRAPRSTLLEACDSVVAIADEAIPLAVRPTELPEIEASGRPSFVVPGAPIPPSGYDFRSLRHLRLGALLGLARPHRVLRGLAARGVFVRASLRFADHRLPGRSWLAGAARLARDERIDAWLATGKCALRLPSSVGGRPVIPVDYKISILPAVRDAIVAALHPPNP